MTERKVLPDVIIPTNYKLDLTPDFEKFTFEGVAIISLEVRDASDSIVLNAAELKFQDVKVTVDSQTHAIDVNDVKFNDKDDVATIPVKLAKGNAVLSIKYSGVIGDSMRGFYRSKFEYGGKEYHMGSTQLESVDARRAFPCWDEPAHKATFDISLVVDSHLTALSNSPVSHVKRDGAKKCVTYERTPKMSTYLVAWAIGEFDYLQGRTENGTRVRVFTRPGEVDKVEFALDVATKVLPLFEKYFDIAYPLEKLDLIAVPEFAMGAMENWGLVTYREVCLFCDQASSQRIREYVTIIIAHELSHQWFGNLVTMDWWSQLWLNEGFASFMEVLASDWMFPEWELWNSFYRDTLDRALSLDAMLNSHPIEVPIPSADLVDENFDTISYLKGGSVVRMIHNYLGADKFKSAIQKYMKHFQYGNADTQDLWKFLSDESGVDVNKIMGNFTLKQGFPLVDIGEPTKDGDDLVLPLKQFRFLSSGTPPAEQDQVTWTIPIVIDLAGEKKNFLLGERETKIRVSAASGYVKFNAQASGVFRVRYPQSLFQMLVKACKSRELPALDRLNFISDTTALARAGFVRTSDVLALLSVFRDEDSDTVWASITDALASIAGLVKHTSYLDKFEEFAQDLLSKIHLKLGWTTQPTDSFATKKLRTTVITALLAYNDKAAIAEAQKIFANYLDSGKGLNPDFRTAVFQSAVRNGKVETFEQMKALSISTTSAEERVRSYGALGCSKDLLLLEPLLEWMLSSHVRKQDVFYIFSSVARNVDGTEIAWNWFKKNYDRVRELFPNVSLFDDFTAVGNYFCSAKKADEFEEFFSKKKCTGFERSIQQTIESVRLRSAHLERDREDMLSWLTSWKPSQ